MWRAFRIAILLVILATVAQTAWLARTRTAEWRTSLRVVIYPVDADGSPVTSRYVAELRKETFDPIEDFFEAEAKQHALALSDPIDIFLAPVVSSVPPAPPFGGSKVDVIVWSLKLRYWAWRNDTHKGPKPDVRLFVLYHDPAKSATLPHSTGLQRGLLGIVNAFATAEMDGSNNVVIAHELLHTFGATDKYDPATNMPLYPDGYAEPDRKPPLPQRYAEIMAGRIPITDTRADVPKDLKRVVIGEKTAVEINWRK